LVPASGRWVNATETYRYRQALVAGGPAIEAVSKAQDDGDWAPRWKGTVSLGWSDRTVTAVMNGYYTGKYRDYNSLREIGNFWIVDANVRWALGRDFLQSDGYLRGTYVEAGAQTSSTGRRSFRTTRAISRDSMQRKRVSSGDHYMFRRACIGEKRREPRISVCRWVGRAG